MARAIDGDALKRWCEKIIDQACHPATVQIGEVFLDKVRSMPTLTPPNEPLTQADLNEMYLNEVWLGYPDGSGETALVVSGKIYSTSSIEGAGLDLDEYIMGETLNNPTGNYKVYRRPPEEDEDA